FFIAIILTLGLSISFQSLLAAWTAPTATPPDGNVGEPINSGPGNQIKTGGLGLGGTFAVVGPTIDIFTVNTVDENVGIGALPAAAYVLDVTGDVNIDGSVRFEDLVNCATIETDASGNLSCGGSASLWTDAGGGVIYYDQVGTENRISVNSSSNSAALAVYQEVDAQVGPTYNYGLAVINTNGTNRTLIWNDNNGYARISGSNDGSDENIPILLNGTGTGWVGINKLGPLTAALDVSGNAHISGNATIDNTVNASNLTTDSGALNLSGSGWGMNFYIDTDNNSNDNYTFYGNGSEIMGLTDTGNLGIGISPSYKLDVNGNARIRGDLTVDGSITGLPAELDPTVLASVKDGVSWSELVSIPDSCAIGSSIRVINADGTVVCETDDAGGGSLWLDGG
ncbi:MAG: hypothetical protein JRE40_16325, partial [Deltaproteobacteria bacterium]|nr:hypothetical protein [Deltaproteobacteria bacterium]